MKTSDFYYDLPKELIAQTAMNLFGYEAGECRLPLVPMSVQGYHDLKDCMEKYDLLSKKVK